MNGLLHLTLTIGILTGYSCGADERLCERAPQGRYSVDFGKELLVACSPEDFDAKPNQVALSDSAFSEDGCGLTIGDMDTCLGGAGEWCGELHWTKSGAYEGELIYARRQPTGAEIWVACIVRANHAILTLTERLPRENQRDR